MKNNSKSKLIVIGDNASGKTALIERLVNHEWMSFRPVTIRTFFRTSGSNYDWIIEDGFNSVVVEMKEHTSIPAKQILSGISSDKDKLFILLVVRKDNAIQSLKR